MRWFVCLFSGLFPLLVLGQEATSGASARLPRPFAAVEHVVIISVDGLRPDRALYANMPHLRSMLRAGSYTFWAKTTPNSITLPSHTSMLTGVSPRKHAIEWNSDLPLLRPIYPRVPTIFELGTRVGVSSALIAGKSKFSTLNKPGTVTHVSIASDVKGSDAEVAEAAVKIIADHKPELVFVHFPDVDGAGHAEGWGSLVQLAAIEKVDEQIGRLLAALRDSGIGEKTVVILSADHGGAGRTHGPDDPRSRHIPWVILGPSVVPSQDLTQIDELEVRTEDTAATALYLLGIPLPDYLDGHPVLAAFGVKR